MWNFATIALAGCLQSIIWRDHEIMKLTSGFSSRIPRSNLVHILLHQVVIPMSWIRQLKYFQAAGPLVWAGLESDWVMIPFAEWGAQKPSTNFSWKSPMLLQTTVGIPMEARCIQAMQMIYTYWNLCYPLQIVAFTNEHTACMFPNTLTCADKQPNRLIFCWQVISNQAWFH